MIADAFIGLGAWAWIILGVVLIGVELIAPGVFFLWLGLAAIVTGLLDAALGLSWQTAALVFALLSVGAVVLAAVRHAARDASTETDAAPLNQRGQALVGRVFTLEAPIKDGEGRIRVDDSSWRVDRAGPAVGRTPGCACVRVDGTTLSVVRGRDARGAVSDASGSAGRAAGRGNARGRPGGSSSTTIRAVIFEVSWISSAVASRASGAMVRGVLRS